jgi:hypothetical protein
VQLGCPLVLGIMCIASIARGDVPIAGHVALGLRGSSTSEAHYDEVFDDTASVRAAAEGLLGLRAGRVVIGLHGGIATPLGFYSSPVADSGEQVATTKSSIYPFDIGLGVAVDASDRFWISTWIGATVSFTRASSPAAHINAIDFTGDIPAASWNDHTTSLGYGVAFAYDFIVDEHGRLAALVAIESQGVAEIPIRYNDGSTGSDRQDLTSRSLTFGVAYRN